MIDGEAYYHCKRLCSGFTQVDLFGEPRYLDSVDSVSAPAEAETASEAQEVTDPPGAGLLEDLPF